MLTRLGLRLAVWRMAYMYCVLDSHSIVVVVEYRIKYYRIGSTFTTTTQPCISWPLHTISLVSPLLRTHPHSPMSCLDLNSADTGNHRPLIGCRRHCVSQVTWHRIFLSLPLFPSFLLLFSPSTLRQQTRKVLQCPDNLDIFSFPST